MTPAVENEGREAAQGRLENAMRQVEVAKAQLEKRQQKARDLLIGEKAAKDPEYRKAVERVRKARHKLHTTRLLKGRKRFSLRRRTAVCQRIEKEIAELDVVDQDVAKQLKQVEADLEKVKNRIAEQVKSQQK